MRVLIICSPDGFANSVKPEKIANYLRARGCQVDVSSTSHLSRAAKTGLAAIMPGPTLRQVVLYLMEAVGVAVSQLGKLQRGTSGTLTKWSVMKQLMVLRGYVLRARFSHVGYDIAICETNPDAAVFDGKRIAGIQILDLPSPYAEEIYFGHKISRRVFCSLRDYEARLYARADRVGFHWHTYASYVKSTKYSGSNYIDISYGVDIPRKRASFDRDPRIVFLGYLGDYWINLKLLAKLCEIYPNIDIYGGPPVANLGLNYKGYAPSTDVLADYQFGLVTLSDDALRRNSFSSKQLRYYSYGLPVLSPNWRRDAALDEASLLYDESNFVKLIREHSEERKWMELSDNAVKIARRYDWENVLRPLESLLPAAVADPVSR